MIGVPFDNNDLSCLGSITEVVAQLVAVRDRLIVDLAHRFPTTAALADWICSLPQRDDEGDPDDGPKVIACQPVQRLRIPAPDPNCVERAALYLAAAELIDPRPLRQLATLDLKLGRHTFPLEWGAPVILDPRFTSEETQAALDAAQAAQPSSSDVPPAESPPAAPIDADAALEQTIQFGEQGARAVRNGANRAWLARNAIRSFVATGTPPTDPHTIDAVGWFFAQAERIARSYGARALDIVRTTARAVSDLLDDVLAQKQRDNASAMASVHALALPEPARNLSFEIGGTSYKVPSWVSGLGSLVGRVGLDVGAVALAPKLAGLGISGQLLQFVEEELNADGLTLGPLTKPGTSMASALGSLNKRSTARTA